MRSAIYSGWVGHRRFTPRQRSFDYRVFMVFAYLSELNQLLSLSPLWSDKKWRPARFKREDFHGDPHLSVDEALRRTVEKKTGRRPAGEIAMLANWRYFGISMNPIVTYYCFNAQGDAVETIVAEVTNTPWNERCAYVLPCDASSRKQRVHFDKAFTVSPFNTLDMSYRWASNTPGKHLHVHIDCERDGATITDATLRLKREEITASVLNKTICRYPWMTLKVVATIYWQALRLALAGVPFLGKNKVHTQPSAIVNPQTHTKTSTKKVPTEKQAELDHYEIH